jgi:hypothetical protein
MMADSQDSAALRATIEENSTLSRFNRPGTKAADLISRGLAEVLEPGEQVLSYADRDLGRPRLRREKDAFAYKHRRNRETDALAYPHEVGRPEADAFAYDTAGAREQPDVLGYEKGGPPRETDAFAYSKPEANPETDAFISDAAGPRAADADLLVLTDRRLIRGLLRNEKLDFREVPCDEGGVCAMPASGTATLTDTGESIEAVWLEITLPDELLDEGEVEVWYWEVPEGEDADDAARKWGRPS